MSCYANNVLCSGPCAQAHVMCGMGTASAPGNIGLGVLWARETKTKPTQPSPSTTDMPARMESTNCAPRTSQDFERKGKQEKKCT